MRSGEASKTKASVRIISVPPGEAPLWVREKWVGLELPLTRWASPKKFLGFGVVSGPRTCLAQLWAALLGRAQSVTGFPVEASRAVEILEASSPQAASWWRENASELIQPKRYLLFHAEACEIIPE
jgi:hypothetical protein